MLYAFALGAVSQLSLVISAVLVFILTFPKRLVGAMAAFGAGALIAAVSRDLLPEAGQLQLVQFSAWALLGGTVFILGEHWVHKKFGSEGAPARSASWSVRSSMASPRQSSSAFRSQAASQ
jgi:zinc transporter, ZIP family